MSAPEQSFFVVGNTVLSVSACVFVCGCTPVCMHVLARGLSLHLVECRSLCHSRAMLPRCNVTATGRTLGGVRGQPAVPHEQPSPDVVRRRCVSWRVHVRHLVCNR
jgi:hypothetical protein